MADAAAKRASRTVLGAAEQAGAAGEDERVESEGRLRIVHLVGEGMSRLRLEQFAEVTRRSWAVGAAGLARVRDVLAVRLGVPASALPAPVPSVVIPRSLVLERAQARELRHVLSGGDMGSGRSVLHVWTEAALPLLHYLDPAWQPMLVDVRDGARLREFLTSAAFRGGRACRVVACHAAVAERFRILAVAAAGRCVVIEPRVATVAEAHAEREAARARLGLSASHAAVFVLPPVERVTGAFHAAWGALLAEKIRGEVRLVLPSEGGDVRRVRELVRACRHDRMLHVAPRGISTRALVAAADVCMYLPAHANVPMDAVVVAARLGRRMIVTQSAADVARESRAAVEMARADDPKDVARQVVGMLDAQVRTLPRTSMAEPADVVSAYARQYDELGRAADGAERVGSF